MKNIRFITFVLILGTLALSACGAATATPAAVPDAATAVKVEAMPVAFVGIVDSIAGDQWVISGTTVTVDASIVHDGPFNIGDRIKVEGLVNPDGSLTVSRVEAPALQETPTQPPLVVDNTNEAIGNANTNDANVNDDTSSGVNSNDDNSNDSNSNDSNTNDDNGGGNTNDDNGNDSNSNDDNGNDSNSNDDNGGNSNSDDDNGNDDNSGGGNDHGGGNDNDDDRDDDDDKDKDDNDNGG